MADIENVRLVEEHKRTYQGFLSAIRWFVLFHTVLGLAALVGFFTQGGVGGAIAVAVIGAVIGGAMLVGHEPRLSSRRGRIERLHR